jgi:hypothetical protein
VKKHEGKRPRRRLDDSIKIDLKGIGCDGMDWFHVAQYRDNWRAVANAVKDFTFPKNAGKLSTNQGIINFSIQYYVPSISQLRKAQELTKKSWEN